MNLRTFASAALFIASVWGPQCLAAGEEARLALVQVHLRTAAAAEQVLGTVVHADGNVVHILAPLTRLMVRRDPIDPTQIHVSRGSERSLVAAPFFQDTRLGLGILTIERSQPGVDAAPILVAQPSVTESASATVFAANLQERAVAGTRLDLGLAAPGSPIVEANGRIAGFIGIDGQGDRRLVAASDAMRALHTSWFIPANRLILYRSLRRIPQALSPDDVASLMQKPGFQLPVAGIPTPQGPVPSQALPFATEIGRRLLDAAQKPQATVVPAVDRVSHHKYELQRRGDATTIVDHATGLMWLVWNPREWRSLCRTRDDELMQFGYALDCVTQLNEIRAAGFRNWRLPTLEELASLLALEPQMQSGQGRAPFHIHPYFGPADSVAWSADPLRGAVGSMWGVCFAPTQRLMPCASPVAWPAQNFGRLFAVRGVL